MTHLKASCYDNEIHLLSFAQYRRTNIIIVATALLNCIEKLINITMFYVGCSMHTQYFQEFFISRFLNIIIILSWCFSKRNDKLIPVKHTLDTYIYINCLLRTFCWVSICMKMVKITYTYETPFRSLIKQ